jgi:hypothetical protein
VASCRDDDKWAESFNRFFDRTLPVVLAGHGIVSIGPSLGHPFGADLLRLSQIRAELRQLSAVTRNRDVAAALHRLDAVERHIREMPIQQLSAGVSLRVQGMMSEVDAVARRIDDEVAAARQAQAEVRDIEQRFLNS